MIPETYTTQSRYEHYPHHSSRTAGFRAVNPESVGQWNGSEYVSDFLPVFVQLPDTMQVFYSREEFGGTHAE